MTTQLEIRIKETISKGQLDSVNYNIKIPQLFFSFEMEDLKALIELLFSFFEKIGKIKKMLKSFEFYRNRPMGIIRLSKFAREK